MINSVVRIRYCWAIVATLLFLAGISSGCTRWAMRYDGPGTVQEMMAVRYQCFQENVVSHERSNASFLGRIGSYSRSGGGTCSMSGFRACLAAKGYYRNRTGRLALPYGTAVHCKAP